MDLKWDTVLLSSPISPPSVVKKYVTYDKLCVEGPKNEMRGFNKTYARKNVEDLLTKYSITSKFRHCRGQDFAAFLKILDF